MGGYSYSQNGYNGTFRNILHFDITSLSASSEASTMPTLWKQHAAHVVSETGSQKAKAPADGQ